ncbi:MAG TPA: hypothetical protein VLC55_07075 [Burkholderiales bacterium]|nr:hypothetical protein [Burkholderiales bacterium]
MKRLRTAILCLLLAAWPASAFAIDPLVLFLLRTLRDQIAMSAAESALEYANQPAPPRVNYLALPSQATVEPEDQRLRATIDQSFSYLTEPQRDQVYSGLMKILSEPENRAHRPQIVESFTKTAQAVQAAQKAIQALSPEEKRALVQQARAEYVKLAPQERQQMLEILRAGHVPLPREITDMMLAAFASADAVSPGVLPPAMPPAGAAAPAPGG